MTSTSDGKTYTYDLNGNMLNGAGRGQSWDADNRLAATTIQGGNSATFAYDYTGTRIKKTTSAGITKYPFSGYEVGADGIITKRIGGVAAKKSTGETLFYHNDHLGGVNLITDATGLKLQLIEYDPWGKVSREEGNADPSRRFTGKELDPETGLMYYGGRYYDPILGRFISPDPFIQRPGDPQSLNRYAYVRNNPVNKIDPTGYFFGSIAKFFKRLFSSVVRSLPAIAVGIVVGIATAGLGAPAILAGALGGMAAGITNAALNRGNIVQGAFFGALLGGIAGGIGPPLYSAFGGGLQGAIGSGFVTGAVVGAIGSALTGGNILESAAGGGITGAVLSAAMYGGYKAYQYLQTQQPELAGGHVPNTPRGQWEGPAPDLEWPTDGPPRGCDDAGCGHWGARRQHQGIRYEHDGFDGAGTRITRSPIPGARGQAFGRDTRAAWHTRTPAGSTELWRSTSIRRLVVFSRRQIHT